MPFKLTNSLATYKHMADGIRQAATLSRVYLDDVLILSQIREGPLQQLEAILPLVSSPTLDVALSKSEFGKKKISR